MLTAAVAELTRASIAALGSTSETPPLTYSVSLRLSGPSATARPLVATTAPRCLRMIVVHRSQSLRSLPASLPLACRNSHRPLRDDAPVQSACLIDAINARSVPLTVERMCSALRLPCCSSPLHSLRAAPCRCPLLLLPPALLLKSPRWYCLQLVCRPCSYCTLLLLFLPLFTSRDRCRRSPRMRMLMHTQLHRTLRSIMNMMR